MPNLVLKKMLELFLKIQSFKKVLEFKDWKKTAKHIQKRNFKPEIKPMIENLHDKLYQVENKQAEGAKLGANIREGAGMECEKCFKTFSKVLSPWDRGEISIKLETKHVIQQNFFL